MKWILVIFLGLCHGTSAQRDLLQAHNEMRISEKGAADMKMMKWSKELADVAQKWANTCREGHNPRRKSRYFRNLGENIYRSTNRASARDVIRSWYSEKSQYNFYSNHCSGVCGHYTQVVWADSEYLGCGVAYCRNLFRGRGGYNYVCNYGPAGNWIGRKPFTPGKQCSRCQRGYGCYKGLCYR
ncbi:GLIPR1-like protein 1 [Saccostrea cucullata]|uniref:GLIPR1-like protein 1 n=1 Tax=Saccostrea cuccullata TaxID=36930 RepID=UPI002ED0CD67